MATKTTNYNLTKPAYDEDADIKVINDNMDIIDTKMKEIENAGGSTQITVDDDLSETSTNPVQNKVISSKINELNSNLSKLTTAKSGAEIDLSHYKYSDGNFYIFPSDGYVMLSSESDASGQIRCVIRSANNQRCANMYMNITNAYQIQSVYVKAGMKASTFDITQNGKITYIPLES